MRTSAVNRIAVSQAVALQLYPDPDTAPRHSVGVRVHRTSVGQLFGDWLDAPVPFADLLRPAFLPDTRGADLPVDSLLPAGRRRWT